ncbi:MAG: dihydrofolate reductase family protein [Henriciella sp.]|nr:dihydrofolate reductase family protein [Henriciella sp.]MBO6696832.1 dihydrofolate reductase family protein [Henriciella sp.]
MHPIIYDVAVSIDGYIDGPNGDVSAFPEEGPIVEDYFARLANYTCAIMGRATYEFGYRFGLQPGENPYPHMRTFVFSNSIDFGVDSDVEVIKDPIAEVISDLKREQTGPIYLCGGGKFSGAFLELGLIDIIRLKRAPIILSGDTQLFGGCRPKSPLICSETREYDNGYLFQEFLTQQRNKFGSS